MKFFKLILSMFLIANVSFAEEYLHANLLPLSYGMFSVFSYVGGLLYHYENQNSYSGLKVDFENVGYYYDPSHGSNWWEYYCEPISLGEKKNNPTKTFNRDEYGFYAYFLEKELNRFQVHDLIRKYIKIKQHVQTKIDNFVANNFKDKFIISLHYRGTDKYSESKRLSYITVLRKLKEYIQSNRLTNYKIFVASDEDKFVKYISKYFGEKIICTNAIRSKNGAPIHTRNCKLNYQKGEEAIIDCVLLSKGNILFKTCSNLSLWSTYFNPNIPVVALSERF